jgi:hypothetical protein
MCGKSDPSPAVLTRLFKPAQMLVAMRGWLLTRLF